MSKVVSKILQLVQKGQLSAASDLITGSKLNSVQSVLNILSGVSWCCHHTPEKCEVEKLEMFCNQMCLCITEAVSDTEQLHTYYLSVYHITRFLCIKERIEDISKLELFIIPQFLQESVLCNSPAQATYKALIKLMSRTISQLANDKNSNHNNFLLQIFKIQLKAEEKLSNVHDMLSLASLCYQQYQSLGATCAQLHTFYNTLLEIVSPSFAKMEESKELIQASLIKIYSDMLLDFIENNDFEFCDLSIEAIKLQVRENLPQEYSESYSMFEMVSNLFPVKLQDLNEKIKKTEKVVVEFKNKNKPVFYAVICSVSRPLMEMLCYYKNKGCNIWTTLSQQTILNVLRFIGDLICQLTQDQFDWEVLGCENKTETSSKQCTCVICILHSRFLRIACQMIELFKTYINQCNTFDDFSTITQWLNHTFKLLKKLKYEKWHYWRPFYSEFCAHVYNIIITLFKGRRCGYSLINKCLLRNIFEIEGTNIEVLSQKNMSFIFTSLGSAEFEAGNFITFMAVVAMYCLLHPEDGSSFIRNEWVKKKAKMEDFLKELTMVDVLHKQHDQLKDIVDYSPLLTPTRKVQLLILEIKSYKEHWRNRASMKACFAQLAEVADIPTFSDVLIQVYGEGDIIMHPEMLQLMFNVKSKFESYLSSSTSSKVKLAFAVLHYYLFEMSFTKKADKNLEEMETTMKVVESAKEKEGIEVVPKEVNDECDIVSAYTNLRLSKFLKVLKLLDTSREILSSLMQDDFEVSVFQITAKLLFAMSLKYRLHNLPVANRQCCFMSMVCAEKGGNSELLLTSLSRLIECGDSKKDFIKKLIDTGDRLSKEFEKDNSDGMHNKILAIYYISKSKLLLQENPEEAYKVWQRADSICSSSNCSAELKILRAELYIVLYKLTKKCSFILGEHEREPITFKLHCAYDTAIAYIKSHPPEPLAISIALDATYELAETYKRMRSPRVLRAYSKDLVVLAQKLVLPLRTVALLILLGYTDVTTGLFDHCRVKLNGIDEILSPSDSQICELTPQLKVEEKVLDKDIDQCTDMIQELVLDLPEHFRQYAPSSPSLTVDTFQLPQFLSHTKFCLCLMCRCTEFQRLLLQKYHLSALANMYEKDDKVAEEFVAGAVKMHEHLNSNLVHYRSKVSQLIPLDLIPDFEDAFLETYANILYEYSYHMSRKGLKDEATSINTSLLESLKPKKLRYVNLYNDLLMQKVSYLLAKKMNKENSQHEDKLSRLTESTSPNLSKTPIRNLVPVKIIVNDHHESVYSPPRRRNTRRCKLFETNEKDDNLLTAAPKSIRKEKSKKFLSEEEEFVFPKPKTVPSAPFPIAVDIPKVSIFSDDEPKRRTYGRKKPKTPQFAFSENEVFTETTSTSKSSKKLSTNGVENDEALKISKPALSKTEAFIGNTTITKSSKKLSVKSTESADRLGTGQVVPVVSESTTKKSRSQLLTQKIKESTRLKEDLLKNKALLPDKVLVEESKENDSSGSLIPESPESREANAASTQFMAKLKSSAKTRKDRNKQVNGDEVKKNLLADFEGNGSSKDAGTIRRSARKRIF